MLNDESFSMSRVTTIHFVLGVNGGYFGGGQTASEFKVGSKPATSFSARSKGAGNCFPLFPARRRIPAQAFAVK